MPYGSYNGPDKPDKGMRGGSCNRTRCQDSNANYWNRGSYSWYCESCAFTLSYDRFNEKSARELGIHPLCIFVDPSEPAPSR